jgi:hypothetical protein
MKDNLTPVDKIVMALGFTFAVVAVLFVVAVLVAPLFIPSMPQAQDLPDLLVDVLFKKP